MSSLPMQLGPTDDTNASLQLVAREIAAELNEARLALEAYAERPEERGLLDRFAGHLHLGRGALRIAEVYGRLAARGGNGARSALRLRPLRPGKDRCRRARCPDARDGAAAGVPRPRRLRRP
jgi:hypothetical protein